MDRIDCTYPPLTKSRRRSLIALLERIQSRQLACRSLMRYARDVHRETPLLIGEAGLTQASQTMEHYGRLADDVKLQFPEIRAETPAATVAGKAASNAKKRKATRKRKAAAK